MDLRNLRSLVEQRIEQCKPYSLRLGAPGDSAEQSWQSLRQFWIDLLPQPHGLWLHGHSPESARGSYSLERPGAKQSGHRLFDCAIVWQQLAAAHAHEQKTICVAIRHRRVIQ